MRFVDQDRELAGPLAGYCLQMVGGELLDRGDDDARVALDGVFELAGCTVDLLTTPGLLELRDGPLQLAVQHHAIRDDDRRIENRLVRASCRLIAVGRPPDRVRLTRTGGMLDQIVVAGPKCGMVHHSPHRVDLVEARENQGLLAVVFLQVDEAADDGKILAGKLALPSGRSV